MNDSGLPGGVVVTGAASGIGRAAALAVAERGAAVAALDVDVGKAHEVAREAESRGAPTAVGLGGDVRREGSVAQAVAASAERIGEIRSLVTCAGIGTGGLVHELELDTWRDVLDTNLTGETPATAS